MGFASNENVAVLHNKCDKESQKYRDEGNQLYVKSSICEAIVLYNKAINFAKSQESLALAYGNRSAAFFTAGKYLECIENISLARSAGYSPDKVAKLNEREQKCIEMMKKCKQNNHPEEDPWFFKLSYEANKKIPWIIEDLELRSTAKYGRGIYAKRDLKPGDIICVEDFTIMMLQKDGYYKHCANCYKINMCNLIPCLKKATFMYCSSDCRNQFYNVANLSGNSVDQVKIILNRINAEFGDEQDPLMYLRTFALGSLSMYDYDFSGSKRQLNIYKSFLSSMNTLQVEEEIVDIPYGYVDNLLLHNSSVYGHLNPKLLKNENCSFPCIYDGIGYTIFCSLLNSSCITNVKYVCVDNKVIFYVKRLISAGEQLFMGYAGEFYNESLYVRSKILARRGVACDCIACSHKLSRASMQPEIFNNPPKSMLNNKEFKTANETAAEAKKGFELMKKNCRLTSMEYMIAEQDTLKLLQMTNLRVMFPFKPDYSMKINGI